jgi:hypothetical protein
LSSGAAQPWRPGDRVRFVKPYDLRLPELEGIPTVPRGATGIVDRVEPTRIWIKVDQQNVRVPVWLPHAFPEAKGKIDILERL